MTLDKRLESAIARVLVDHLGGRQFDYLIPEDLSGVIRVGSRVRVPFGGRKALGTVLEIVETSDVSEERLKPLEAAVSKLPEIGPSLMRLADWIASYYICTKEAALRAMLPQPVRKAEIGHRRQRMVRLLKKLPAEEEKRLKKKAPRQATALEILKTEGGTLSAADLVRRSALNANGLGALAKAGLVEIIWEVRERDPYDGETILPSRPLELNAEQKVALDLILAPPESDGSRKPVLLYGVTGSGKTEVYLQALAAVLKQGRGGIVLVPEIALTPQTVDRFRGRFVAEGVNVAVLHSHLSAGERHDEWHRIRRGDAKVVIGARSAVFAPIENPGLIIVDEEHEHSYKQEEAPHYNARDLAVVRGRIEQAAVVLGSATPSFETYHNALTGKYSLANLTKRVDDQQMPLIRVIDMRMERTRQKGSGALSERLIAAIKKRIDRKEQVILFLNRRGYATTLICPSCGAVIGCPHCSVPLTWHRAANRMSCHFCHYAEVVPQKCPACGKPGLRDVGTGTERVEESLQRSFEGAIIKRMDADTMSRKGAYRETLEAFRTGKIDILVGTQMIAKGLHFPNVTLVGIVNADLGLHLPDFRAGERTFQLLTQVAGRAGRGDMAGEVLIQTFTPTSASIQYSRRHDFVGFFEEEAEFRKKYFYPPFCHLILIKLRSKNAELVKLTATLLAKAIQSANPPPDSQGGEALPAPIEKLAGETRMQIILRSKSVIHLSQAIARALSHFHIPEEVRISIDVDAYELL